MTYTTLQERKDYIPLKKCKKGFIYEIHSRNLCIGVYDGKHGFIGIREKFGNEFLFTEMHWDDGPPFGTTKPIRVIKKLPKRIQLSEELGTIDMKTQLPVGYDKEKQVWYFLEGNWASEDIRPCSVPNAALFTYLHPIDFKIQVKRTKQYQQQVINRNSSLI